MSAGRAPQKSEFWKGKNTRVLLLVIIYPLPFFPFKLKNVFCFVFVVFAGGGGGGGLSVCVCVCDLRFTIPYIEIWVLPFPFENLFAPESRYSACQHACWVT